jgi:hypothetical protein
MFPKKESPHEHKRRNSNGSVTSDRGGYANEQELVNDILRAAVPVFAQYQQLRRDVQASLDDAEQGKVRDADFDAVRKQLCQEYDESGNRR